MKKTMRSNRNTFSKLDIENVIVLISACKPLYLLSNLSSLDILRILKTLANCGPILSISIEPDALSESRISMMLHITTNISKLFQFDEKYTVPKAISFSNHSTVKIAVNTKFMYTKVEL